MKRPRRRRGPKPFAPVGGYKDPRNCKTLLIVERDGSVRERTTLQVPDVRHREQLICIHYLRHYAHIILQKEVAVRILSRDAPWDFDIELSNGERFFVEITAIADNDRQFEFDKREERLLQARQQERIRLGELRKLAFFFPDPALDEAVAATQSLPSKTIVPNPVHEEGKLIFESRIDPPHRSIGELIEEAIGRKAGKAHAGKDRTILLLDFRGHFLEQEDLVAVRESLEELFETAPFPEIWFYIGYFSDDDGNNAEYSFVALKLPDAKADRVLRLAGERGLDREGRLVW